MKSNSIGACSLATDTADEGRFDDPRVVAAVQAFFAALEAGSPPDREEFIARHPDIASELRQCLGALEFLDAAAPELGPESPGPSDALTAGLRLLGDYRLLRELGRGGMGVVYEALQVSLNRRVAVKTLPFAAALDRAHLQRFRNEAQAAAQLHHANIVPVYAVGVERGVHFYVMQIIDGEPLDRLIASLRQMSGKQAARHTRATALGDSPSKTFLGGGLNVTEDLAAATSLTAESSHSSSAKLVAGGNAPRDRFRLAADLVRQAALGLEHAHQFGVVHRDVKPANLLVDEQGQLWITDFGLAHIQADVTLTRTGDVMGTLRYMSPEQAAGNRLLVDHRTDVYSLGATLYELLTLEPVFAESDRHALSRRIIEDEPRAPRSLDPHVPAELETIVFKAMSKAPQDRYATAKAFADDLQRWLDDKPVLARRPTLAEQAVKWRRRHRSLVKMAATFLLLAFLGLAASTAMIATEQSKTKEALRNEMNQRLAADESFRQARQAVDAFTALGEQELASDPPLQSLRRKFLETSLEYYQSFLTQRGDDPLVQADLAASSERVERLIDDLAVLEGFAALPLLRFAEVREDLHISAEQCGDLEEGLSRLREARDRPGGGRAEKDPQPHGRRLADALRAQQKKISLVLDPRQMLRLKQIFWQQQGPFAFLNSEVVAALHLSANDCANVRRIIDEDGLERGPPQGPGRRPEPRGRGPLARGPFDDRPPPPPRGPHNRPYDREPRRGQPPPDERDGPPDRPLPPPGRRAPPRERGEGFHNSVERILELLSDDQRQKWYELISEPFDADLGLRPEDWSAQGPAYWNRHPGWFPSFRLLEALVISISLVRCR